MKDVGHKGARQHQPAKRQARSSSRQHGLQQTKLVQLARLALNGPDRTLDQLIDETTRLVADGLLVGMTAFWALEDERETLVLRSGIGWHAGLVGEHNLSLDANSLPCRTLRHAHPLAVVSTDEPLHAADSELLADHKVSSSLAVIVEARKHRFGVLSVHATEPRAYSAQDTEFLQSAADILAAALETNRRAAELRNNQRRLLAGIVRDMVERREVEHALRRSEERYRALQLQYTEFERMAVAGELAGTVAHEIRTPLNALSLNAQMLERALRRGAAEDLERAQGLVSTLRGEIERINDLLQDYLQVLRRPARQTIAPLSLNQAIEDAVRLVEPRATEGKVQIGVSLSPQAQIVTGDEGRLRQVLLNLFLNAIQAMPDGGELRIVTELLDDVVSLKVCDNGAGIAEADLERIFQPFVTTKEQGTGLGLAISDRLIKDMGGSIGATSTYGQGACFEIRLPCASDIEPDRE